MDEARDAKPISLQETVTKDAPLPTATATVPSKSSIPATQGGSVSALTYNNIRSDGLGDLGQFRTLKEKFGWRVRKAVGGVDPTTRKTIQLEGSDVATASWLSTEGREFAVKIVMKDGELLRFDGFKEMDFEPLRRHMREFWGTELVRERVATRGWHWGVGKVAAKHFSFVVNNETAFDVASRHISQTSTAKADVTLVLDSDEQRCEVEDQLLEIRLFIPPSKNGNEEEAGDFRKALLGLPGSKVTPMLQTVCTFFDLKVLVPAGRFDVQVMRTAMKLQGKSNDFTIPFKTVTQMFLLHSPSPPHVNLVMRLATPLRKGHTPYFNVVIQFDKKKTIDLELGLSEEELKAIEVSNPPGFETDLSPTMSGSEYELATRVIKALTSKDVLSPKTFKSSTNQPCFRSSYKADSGNFYPLESGFVFIPKPVIIVQYDEIASVSFGRTSGSQTKLCEFDVVLHGGQMYSFSSVDRQESGPLIDFLQRKNVKVGSFRPDDKTGDVDARLRGVLGGDDDDDDEDDEDDPDYDEDDDEEDSSEDEESDDASYVDEDEDSTSKKKAKPQASNSDKKREKGSNSRHHDAKKLKV